MGRKSDTACVWVHTWRSCWCLQQSLTISLFSSHFLSHTHTYSLSLSLSLYLAHSLALSHSLSLSIYIYVHISLYIFLSRQGRPNRKKPAGPIFQPPGDRAGQASPATQQCPALPWREAGPPKQCHGWGRYERRWARERGGPCCDTRRQRDGAGGRKFERSHPDEYS